MQDIQVAYNEEIEKALKARHLPYNDMPTSFLTWLPIMLHFESRVTLGCDFETFKRMHEISRTGSASDLTLFEMGFILNAMERRTPDDFAKMGSSYTTYLECMEVVSIMTTKWNEIVTPIKNAIVKKLQTQAKISQGVPAGKKIIA
jgi:hypothetical protein